MDFEKILQEWERQKKKKPSQASQSAQVAQRAQTPQTAKDGADKATELDGGEYMRRWLARNGVPDAREREQAEYGGGLKDPSEAGRIRRMKPQASIDLHGKTVTDAELLLESFLSDSRRRGLEKVLIIHGKGLHSASEPVLAAFVRKALERSEIVGAFGPADRVMGGRGATWARIRKGDYFSR